MKNLVKKFVDNVLNFLHGHWHQLTNEEQDSLNSLGSKITLLFKEREKEDERNTVTCKYCGSPNAYVLKDYPNIQYCACDECGEHFNIKRGG